jgi:hypothetical protein
MPNEDFEEYEKELKKFERYRLTLNRESLNEVLSCLSSSGKVDVLVDAYGEVSFNIPPNAEIDVRSINIIDVMLGVMVDIEKEQLKVEKDSKRFKELETSKNGVSFSIEMTRTILDELEEIDDIIQDKTEDEDKEETGNRD